MATTKSMTCPVCATAKDFIYIGLAETKGVLDVATEHLYKCPTCKVVIAS